MKIEEMKEIIEVQVEHHNWNHHHILQIHQIIHLQDLHLI